MSVQSGLYSFRNREYSPTLSRWSTIDPIAYLSSQSNLYMYMSNNNNYYDPFGLEKNTATNSVKGLFGTTLGNAIKVKYELDASNTEKSSLYEEMLKNPDIGNRLPKADAQRIGVAWIASDPNKNESCGNDNKGERVWLVFGYDHLSMDGTHIPKDFPGPRKFDQWFLDVASESFSYEKSFLKTTIDFPDYPGWGTVNEHVEDHFTQLIAIGCRCKKDKTMFLKGFLASGTHLIIMDRNKGNSTVTYMDNVQSGAIGEDELKKILDGGWVNLMPKGIKIVDEFK